MCGVCDQVLKSKLEFDDAQLPQFLLQLVDARLRVGQLEQHRLVTKVRQDLSLQQAELFSLRLEFDLALAKLTTPPCGGSSPRQLDVGSLWEDLRDVRRELHCLKATQTQHTAELASFTTSCEQFQGQLAMESNEGPYSKINASLSSDLSQSLGEMSQMIHMINVELNTELTPKSQPQSTGLAEHVQGIASEPVMDFADGKGESAETLTTLQEATENAFPARLAVNELRQEIRHLLSEVEDIRNERKLLFKAAKASAIQELKTCPVPSGLTPVMMWDENEEKKLFTHLQETLRMETLETLRQHFSTNE